jgi:hypothetical protein
MARSHSQCEVLHQDFLAMQLPESRFDGVFANASLFHVPSQEMPKVLLVLRKTLKPRGVLFSSNPRGNNEEETGIFAIFSPICAPGARDRRRSRCLHKILLTGDRGFESGSLQRRVCGELNLRVVVYHQHRFVAAARRGAPDAERPRQIDVSVLLGTRRRSAGQPNETNSGQ